MKKFYIPTSTQNFNNILSSESISPKAFYAQRDYGYSRWVVIPENPYQNAIVLYDYKGFFNRPQSDIEDHPLLIEVELDESELNPEKGFYYCDHTIYLSPTTTRFIFFSEKDKTIALSMSESSLETKLLHIYGRRFSIEKETLVRYSPVETVEPCVLNKNEIDKDVRINKMKGLLYGYYIGAFLSTDVEKVKRLNVLKEINNIFAAIWSSIEKRPSELQDKRLDELFLSLNKDNTDYQVLMSIVRDKTIADSLLSLPFVNPRGWVEKLPFLRQLSLPSNNEGEVNPAIEWIKGKIADEKKLMEKCYKNLSPEEGQILVIEREVAVIKSIPTTNELTDDINNKLFKAWTNETLANGTNGKIGPYRDSLAESITRKAKFVMQETWETSYVRSYLNDLRRHIHNEEFNHSWNNGLLSSIAAVILSGDDWEKMLAFMQSKEMTDYRLAYAFYGELNGFANLTRDFTDLLYEQIDKTYVWNVYKEFYGQLFGKDCPKSSIPLGELRGVKINSMDRLEDSSGMEEREENFPDVLRHIFECADFNSLNPKAKEYYQKESLGLWSGMIDKTFLEQLELLPDKCPVSKTKTKWKNCLKSLKNQIQGKAIQCNNETEHADIFHDELSWPISNYFYLDKNVWYHLEPLIKSKDAKRKIKKDLDWFLSEISRPNKLRDYYQNLNVQDNKAVIEKFCNLKKGDKTASYFTEELRECIKTKLMELYHLK